MSADFTAKDIVSIIAACHKNNVNEIHLPGVHISFRSSDALDEGQVSNVVPTAEDWSPVKGHDEFQAELEKMTLLAEDPSAYERLMVEEYERDALQSEQAERNVSDLRYSS